MVEYGYLGLEGRNVLDSMEEVTYHEFVFSFDKSYISCFGVASKNHLHMLLFPDTIPSFTSAFNDRPSIAILIHHHRDSKQPQRGYQ